MIRVTDRAKEKIISILTEESQSMIRFGLQGGGCNGFSYFLAIEEKMEDDDLEFPLGDIHRIIIDAASNMYLESAEIDYKKDLMGESFVFTNPMQTTKCGCGSSVSFD